MTFDNPDFIIKNQNDSSERKNMETLRRYKGHESVVTIPDGVEKIDNYVFADDIEPNETITKIIIPDSVKTICAFAFSYCNALKEIRFPKNLHSFHVKFANCPSIEEIWIPESVERIGNLDCTDAVKAIHVGQNITWVNFTDFCWETNESFSKRKKRLIETLLTNPAYKIIDGFMVNVPYKTVLFRADGSRKEMRIPDGMEIIRNGTFYELIMSDDMVPIEKIIIPASVKEIKNLTFHCCNSLKEVKYEGNSSDLTLGEVPFYMCAGFHHDGSDIICKDRPKNEKKRQVKVGWDRLTRIFIINRAIRSGMYPNIKKLIELCNQHGINVKGETSIYRDFDDILMFSNTYCLERTDLISYDTQNKGFHYTQDFELDIEGTLLGL